MANKKAAGNLGNGLEEQLQEFMKQHTDTRLIIIDTLQKVREVGGDNYSYANDYEVITRLKQFADSYGICILLVHHTRKTRNSIFSVIPKRSCGIFKSQKQNYGGSRQSHYWMRLQGLL